MARRLRTGIDALDREIGGGIPPGSVVAFTAPPASQSELLLYELTSVRDTLYLTTDRADHAVADALDRTAAPVGDPDIRFVAPDAPLENARRMARDLAEGMNLIVDPADTLEREDRTRYRNFLNELQNHMHNTGGLAVLHCLDGTNPPGLRDATTHMADVVFDLQVSVEGEAIDARLAVPKFRGGRALDETLKLELADRIRVDTSRDIA